MKRQHVTLVCMLFISSTLFLSACQQQETTTGTAEKKKEITKDDLKKNEDIASYGMGLGMGKNFLKKLSFELNMDIFLKGIEDGMADGEQLMPDDEIRTKMQAFQKEITEKKAAENLEKGKTFLEENKGKEGIVALPSGLQYKILKEGDGPMPKETDRVSVHYIGKTLDGTEFDNSIKRNRPAKFNVNRVVKGWTEALQLMKVGSKWELFIPSDLAYGEKGAGRNIGPNETLHFEVELIGIEEPPAKKESKPAPEKKADAEKKEEKK